jgi:hypothetical protein
VFDRIRCCAGGCHFDQASFFLHSHPILPVGRIVGPGDRSDLEISISAIPSQWTAIGARCSRALDNFKYSIQIRTPKPCRFSEVLEARCVFYGVEQSVAAERGVFCFCRHEVHRGHRLSISVDGRPLVTDVVHSRYGCGHLIVQLGKHRRFGWPRGRLSNTCAASAQRWHNSDGISNHPRECLAPIYSEKNAR